MARSRAPAAAIGQPMTVVTGKRPFDPAVALPRIREAVRPFPKAALFQLAEEGFDSVFEQVVACIISIRTRDEVTLPVARDLFRQARRPREIASLTVLEIDNRIQRASFHEAKAAQIQRVASLAVDRYGGALPCEAEALLALPGVGPKCANLALGIACKQPVVAADIHVHRVANRWGYIKTRTPEESWVALQDRLPREHWIELNALLVPFGKHICTGHLPLCSTCPVLEMCAQAGVGAHR